MGRRMTSNSARHRVASGAPTGKWPEARNRWLLQGSSWLFVAYLIYAQAIPAFDYELGTQMGTQESAEQVTGVGVAYWWAFAFGDLVAYLPLLSFGLIGHLRGRRWGYVLLAVAFGITVYWPVVSLAAVVAARDAPGWALHGEAAYWTVLPLIALWGVWGLWRVCHDMPGGPGDPSYGSRTG
jgi:hypothetical protein